MEQCNTQANTLNQLTEAYNSYQEGLIDLKVYTIFLLFDENSIKSGELQAFHFRLTCNILIIGLFLGWCFSRSCAVFSI